MQPNKTPESDIVVGATQAPETPEKTMDEAAETASPASYTITEEGNVTACDKPEKTTLNNTSDTRDFDEIEDGGIWDSSQTAGEVDDYELPEWVRAIPDKAAVKWNTEHGFYYLTEEDRKNGLSHYVPTSYSYLRNYDCGPYGTLCAVVIDGQAWCPLNDATFFAGVPRHWITGYINDGEVYIRGMPGLLNPDGIRYLSGMGISGDAIHLEALVAHVKEHRKDDPRVLFMLQSAINDIYDKRPGASTATDIPLIDLWRRFGDPIKPGQTRQHTYYEDFVGEYVTLLFGTQLWFRLDDICDCTHLEPAIISKIAGPDRILTISNSKVYPLYDTVGEKTYVRADVIKKIDAAMRRGPSTGDSFHVFIAKRHPELLRAGQYGLTVNATLLHGMLGPHLDFHVWSSQIWHKYVKILREGDVAQTIGDHDDYAIPLHVAFEIAVNEGTFAGKITAALLADGGFLHGGSIDEAADATLIRFQGLVPDRHGRVPIRKIWEFLNSPRPYAEWYQDGLDLNWPKDRESPDMPTASINSAWASGIWQSFDSDHGVDLK